MKNIADRMSIGASPTAALDLQRCRFSSADGRRCRMPRWEAHAALCVSHAGAEAKKESQRSAARNFAGELAPLSGEFRTATDVNHALGRLFSLLAQNRIPRRNAVALGYLAQLLLQTLPGVRDELTHCLGYDAWDETLESVFGQAKTEDETEEDETADVAENEPDGEDEVEDNREASLIESGCAQAASERQRAFATPVDERPIDKEKIAPAPTEPVPLPLLVVAAPTHQAEIPPEPESEEFVPQLPEPYNYWKELEQNEQLRRARH